MELSMGSISNSLSKDSMYEGMSMLQASMDDAASRLADGIKPEVISNERIQNGDEILETYRVTSDAIHGGMGSVWRVHHKNWDVDLAMKRPQPRFFAEGSSRRKEEFVAECENWIKLGLHPNIVSCYYVRDIGGVPSIFSEWMDNGSLKDRIRDSSLYEGSKAEVQKRILDIAIQTARGLMYSHENNLIHQDVKPGNILLTKKWDVKVADFGLARAENSLNGGNGSKSSGYTLANCPQEQIDCGEPARWMDVYAWAVTILEMYAGKRLWETGVEVKNRYGEFALKCEHEIPEKMKGLLKSCIVNIPDDDKTGFSSILKELENIWQKLSGKRYPMIVFGENALVSAVNLNNYALSMIDMGKKEAADTFFEKSLSLQPDIVSARINQAFFAKKNGSMSYEEAMKVFQNLPDSKEKEEAIRTLISEHFALEEVEPLTGRDNFQLSACFDSSGCLWLLCYERPDSVLYRYDGETGKILGTIGKRAEYDSIVMDSDGRYLYAVNMGRPFCSSISRIDTLNCSVETFDVDFDDEAFERFCEENKIFGARHKGTCIAAWLEDHDRKLCILEDNQWKDQGDDFFTTYSFSEFNVADQKPISMIGERQYLGEYTGVYHQYESSEYYKRYLAATAGRKEKEKSYHEDAVAVNFTEDRVLLSNRIGVVTTKVPTLYRPYPQRDQHHVYMLNRFSDAGSVKEWIEERTEFEKAFAEAVRQGEYKKAIRIFEKYRELPECRDAAATVDMEIKLAAVCRRVRLHHSIEAADCGFDPGKKPFFKPADFYWYRKEKFKKKDKPEGVSDQVFAALCKAVKNNDMYFPDLRLLLIDGDEKNAYVQAENTGIFRLDVETAEFTILADLKGKSTYNSYGSTLMSPNGKILAVQSSYMNNTGIKEMYYIFDGKNVAGWSVLNGESFFRSENPDVPRPKGGRFTPDSRFLAWRDENTDIYYMSGLHKKGDYVQVYDSKNLDGQPQFSGDGFFLAVKAGDGTTIRTFRLSYDYQFDGFRDWDDEADLFARQFIFEHPAWDDQQLDSFMDELRLRGLGNLRKEGVKKKLIEMSQANQKKPKGLFSFLQRTGD